MSAGNDTRILVIDDDPQILDFAATVLEREAYRVETCDSSKKSLLLLHRHDFDLVLLDLVMPEMDGIEVASHIQNNMVNAEIIIMTGEPDEDRIDRCKQMGIAHFLFKPFSAQQLNYTVYAGLYSKRMEQALADRAGRSVSGMPIIGVSMAIRHLREEIEILAPTDLPVLLEGETGTGKELVAREIHERSRRRGRPFFPVNCATLGELAESELFGHEKGAFTGAVRSTRGCVGSADGGTLFLDEIGDLPLSLQAKLLRFLDSGEYRRVGDSRTRKADVRVISATNCDLETMCQENRFRQDLYFRISGARIRTLPLRDHPEDIPLLTWHFIEEFSFRHNRTFQMAPDAVTALSDYEWPGNVRQLKYVVQQLCERSLDGRIQYRDVANLLGINSRLGLDIYRRAKEKALRDFDIKYFSEVITAAQGKLKKALEITGMHKKNFYTKLRELELSLKEFAPESQKGGIPKRRSDTVLSKPLPYPARQLHG